MFLTTKALTYTRIKPLIIFIKVYDEDNVDYKALEVNHDLVIQGLTVAEA